MGPAGLMAGTRLLELGYSVSFYDHKKAAGRKFLVAGNNNEHKALQANRTEKIKKN